MISTKFPHLTTVAKSLGILTIVLTVSSCTTNGGLPQTSTTAKATVTNQNVNFPTIEGAPGAAPTIIAPQGTPPEKLEIKDLVVGHGSTVGTNSTVTVHYLLMGWKSGKIIDSSWSRGAPATFGLSQVIPGWQQGMPGMKVGGRRELLIPPSLGYGDVGSGPVGPKETLIFVVDLISIQ